MILPPLPRFLLSHPVYGRRMIVFLLHGTCPSLCPLSVMNLSCIVGTHVHQVLCRPLSVLPVIAILSTFFSVRYSYILFPSNRMPCRSRQRGQYNSSDVTFYSSIHYETILGLLLNERFIFAKTHNMCWFHRLQQICLSNETFSMLGDAQTEQYTELHFQYRSNKL